MCVRHEVCFSSTRQKAAAPTDSRRPACCERHCQVSLAEPSQIQVSLELHSYDMVEQTVLLIGDLDWLLHPHAPVEGGYIGHAGGLLGLQSC